MTRILITISCKYINVIELQSTFVNLSVLEICCLISLLMDYFKNIAKPHIA